MMNSGGQASPPLFACIKLLKNARAVFRLANGDQLITDAYKLVCANVSAPSNKVNSADARAIFQHSNGQKSLWTD